jgi:hypothetical protein
MISAKQASALANAYNKKIMQELFEKTIGEIEDAIVDSFQKGFHSCSYDIPLQIKTEIEDYLKEFGYKLSWSNCQDLYNGTKVCWINW